MCIFSLNEQQAERQSDCPDEKAGNQPDPVAERPEVRVGCDNMADRQTDPPEGNDPDEECHVDILIAAERPLNRCLECIRQLEKRCEEEELGSQGDHPRIGCVQGSDRLPEQEQDCDGQKAEADRERNREQTVLLGIVQPGTAGRLSDEDGGSHRNTERNHIEQGRKVQSDLVCRNDFGRILGHEQRHDRENARLHEDGKADRHSDE